MIKRFSIFIALFVFILCALIVCIKIHNSLSPLRSFAFLSHDSVEVSKNAQIKLLPPMIADHDGIYCVASIRIASEVKNVLCKFQPEQGSAEIVADFNQVEYQISGYSYDGEGKLLLMENDLEQNVMILYANDSVMNMIYPPDFSGETMSAVSLVDGNAEFVTISDSVPSFFSRYVCKSNKGFVWDNRQLKFNSFFNRITKPLTACYSNHWYYFAVSEFYRRDSLYVNVPQGTTNVMLFRNNLSYHFDDIRISKKTFSGDHLDPVFSGLLDSKFDCNDKFIYNPAKFEFVERICPKENHQFIPLYFLNNNSPDRYYFYKILGGNNTDYMAMFNNSFRKISMDFDNASGKTILQFPDNENPEFASSVNQLNELFVVPFKENYVVMTENGEFCVLDKNAERTDDVGFMFKMRNFILTQLKIMVDHPGKFRAYTFPLIVTGFPLMFVLSLFIFFVVRVFLTPKRPSYSSRKIKKAPFSNYLFPFALMYLLTVVVFLYNFVVMLRTL